MNTLKILAGSITLFGLACSGVVYSQSYDVNSRGPLHPVEVPSVASNARFANSDGNVNSRGPVRDKDNLISSRAEGSGHILSRGPLRPVDREPAIPHGDQDIAGVRAQ